MSNGIIFGVLELEETIFFSQISGFTSSSVAYIFPDIFIQLIASGYRSGNLEKMFNKVSNFMKSEIETKRSVFLSLLEPIVIIFMGGFIMMIVLAILIPIMQMNTLAI